MEDIVYSDWGEAFKLNCKSQVSIEILHGQLIWLQVNWDLFYEMLFETPFTC